MTQVQTQRGKVAVFGATGHTARFVVSELLRRGITPIAIARDPLEVTEGIYLKLGASCYQATVDDAASLDRAIEGAQVLVNCAGPFADTADALARAALRAGIHYVDVCAEQLTAHKTLEKFDEPARKAGVVVLPSMAFYGGLADLMVTTALGEDWNVVDSIEVMIGFDSWHPTRGTRTTIDRIVEPPMVVSGGRLTPKSSSPTPKNWNFGGSMGNQAMVEVPFSEIVLISRHVKTTELHNYINQLAVSDALDPKTPTPKAADERGRSQQQFVIEAVITRAGERRRAIVRGRDIYAVSAPLVCEAVTRLLAGKFRKAGANAPGEIFDAKEVLAALGPENATIEVLTDQSSTTTHKKENYMNQNEKAKHFAKLHVKGNPILLYNAWDAGSARSIVDAGAQAIATSSWSVAAAQGYEDGEDIPIELVEKIIERITATVDVPVTVDFEGGYSEDDAKLAKNLTRLLDLGVIGINFEDRIVKGSGLYSIEQQARRIAVLRKTAKKKGVDLFINARTDLFLGQGNDPKEVVGEALERAKAYAAAGASGFFVPGLDDAKLIRQICDGVEMPVNIMMMDDVPSVEELSKLGVSRVSYGPAPYITAMEELKQKAVEIAIPLSGFTCGWVTKRSKKKAS